MFKNMLYGGDYSPEQWDKKTWMKDIQVFKEANINSATINVFSWAKLQPSEDEFYFDELDEIIDKLSEEDYAIVLATSTAAMPAWMFKNYPEVARVDYDGRQHKFGGRHNACPNSLAYQKFAKNLVSNLAKRYGKNPHVACWHINNEYGGQCFCEKCEKEFRVWLKKKYKTIDAVNESWNMSFWGHTLYDWDEIVAPNALSDGIGRDKTAFTGISLDYRRFMSDSLLMNFKLERNEIKKVDSMTPITTNLMGTYKGLDYFKWAKEMDIVSWDNYPSYDTPWSQVAMNHDLMRGLKNAPFMLMEQTPSQQNWQPYNSLKKPGQMRAQSYQTIAHGGDTIQFFQLKRSRGGCEKFHGAVLEHSGYTNTRVFSEVKQLGEELSHLNEIIDSANPSEVGIIFDWDNYWALEYTSGPSVDLKYVDQIHQFYRYFYEMNISVDMIPFDADFSRYKIIVAPVLYMIKNGMEKHLTQFVESGGTLVTSFMSGLVGESDNIFLGGYPGPLRQMTGIWVEEIDALAPEQENYIQFEDGTQGICHLLCDIIHLEGAKGLAYYKSNFYENTPVVTQNEFGEGHAYYIGSQLEAKLLEKVLNQVVREQNVQPVLQEKTKLEVVRRRKGETQYFFIINFQDEKIKLPQEFVGKKDLLTGEILKDVELSKYTTYIIKA